MGRKVKLLLEPGVWIVDLDAVVHAEWASDESTGDRWLKIHWIDGKVSGCDGEKARALWSALDGETRGVEFADPLEESSDRRRVVVGYGRAIKCESATRTIFALPVLGSPFETPFSSNVNGSLMVDRHLKMAVSAFPGSFLVWDAGRTPDDGPPDSVLSAKDFESSGYVFAV